MPPSPQPRLVPAPLPLLRLGGFGPLLEIGRGRYCALLGDGASSLLALVAGFAPAAGHELLLDGRPIGRTPAHRRDIALVGPGAALLGHLSVAGNLALVAGRRAAAEGLERLRLAELAGFRPNRLSPEQLVRAELARALASRPQLLLLDDPLRGLAPGMRAALGRDLRRMHQDLGLTVLHATSDAAEALALADQAAVLAGGRLRQVGPPQALYDEPASALVAGLLGEANFLPGIYAGDDDDLAEIHLDCGVAVRARPVDAVRGQRCLVAIRPERIALAAVTPEEMGEEMGEGALPATVQEVAVLGDHLRLRLIVGAPGAPAALISVRRPAGAPIAGLSVGAPAALAWQPHHAGAFRPESGAAR